jgi:hypothetical protein
VAPAPTLEVNALAVQNPTRQADLLSDVCQQIAHGFAIRALQLVLQGTGSLQMQHKHALLEWHDAALYEGCTPEPLATSYICIIVTPQDRRDQHYQPASSAPRRWRRRWGRCSTCSTRQRWPPPRPAPRRRRRRNLQPRPPPARPTCSAPAKPSSAPRCEVGRQAALVLRSAVVVDAHLFLIECHVP